MPAIRVCAMCAVVAWAAAAEVGHAAPQTPAPPVTEGQPAESRLQFYGFIRQDVILDDSRADSAQSPLFILSEPADAGAGRTYTLHPRLTRFGVNLSGPALEPLGGARMAGKLEMDFRTADATRGPSRGTATRTCRWPGLPRPSSSGRRRTSSHLCSRPSTPTR